MGMATDNNANVIWIAKASTAHAINRGELIAHNIV